MCRGRINRNSDQWVTQQFAEPGGSATLMSGGLILTGPHSRVKIHHRKSVEAARMACTPAASNAAWRTSFSWPSANVGRCGR
jgi:hypothetical protein